MSTRTRRTVLALFLGLAGCGGTTSAPTAQTVENLEFLGFVDDAGDGMPYAHEPRTVHLADFFAENRPGTKIVMLNAAAGWCGPCMKEASAMDDFAAAYEARGVVVLTAIIQKENGAPADREFAESWGETFGLKIPILIDSAFVTGKYIDLHTMPSNLFINASTHEILGLATGAEPGTDPMKAYRDLLDYHLSKL